MPVVGTTSVGRLEPAARVLLLLQQELLLLLLLLRCPLGFQRRGCEEAECGGVHHHTRRPSQSYGSSSFLLVSSAWAVRKDSAEESTASPEFEPVQAGRGSGGPPLTNAARCGRSSAARAQRDCPAASPEVEAPVAVARRAALAWSWPSSVPVGQSGAETWPGP